MAVAAVLSLALASTGCSDDQGRGGGGVALTLATDRAAYGPGQSVGLTLTNASDLAVGYNFCDYRLELEQGAQWVRHDDPQRVCERDLLTLDAHASTTGTIILPSPVAAGDYRLRYSGIVTDFQAPANDLATVVSPTFTVRTTP
jgi:hypothetical protein